MTKINKLQLHVKQILSQASIYQTLQTTEMNFGKLQVDGTITGGAYKCVCVGGGGGGEVTSSSSRYLLCFIFGHAFLQISKE